MGGRVGRAVSRRYTRGASAMIWGGKNLGFGTGVQAEPARSGSGAPVGCEA